MTAPVTDAPTEQDRLPPPPTVRLVLPHAGALLAQP